MDIIHYFDINIIEYILSDINLKNFFLKKSNNFIGIKLDKEAYFLFFFSLYKKNVLLFTFRTNVVNKEKIRIYVKEDNKHTIKTIIKYLLNGDILSENLYKQYEFIDEIQTSNNDSVTQDVKKIHLKIDNYEPIIDINGTSIESLNMSIRATNALYRYDIFTIKQLIDVPNNILKQFKFLGRKSYKEILNKKNEILGINDYLKINESSLPECINPSFFYINYDNYKNLYFDEELKMKCEKFSKEFINKLLVLINYTIINDRDRNIFIRYNDLDNTKNITLKELGKENNISYERVRQIVNKVLTKLKKQKKYLLEDFNRIVGKEQYHYLISIMNYKSFRCLDTILHILLNVNEYNFIKNTLLNCIYPKKKKT